jgi:hypothetical protein
MAFVTVILYIFREQSRRETIHANYEYIFSEGNGKIDEQIKRNANLYSQISNSHSVAYYLHKVKQ